MLKYHRPISGARLVRVGLLALWLVSACNLVLDNEKRSLKSGLVDSSSSRDAATSELAADGGDRDGDPDPSDAATQRSCGGNRFPQCLPNAIEPGVEACGECGIGMRTRQRGCTIDCRWGSWSEWSDCQEPAGACTPGAPDEKMEPCGECNLGTRKTTRSCTSSCGWSDWTPESCTEPESSCHPGEIMKLADLSCGTMCGHASQTRTCNASCNWEPIATGMCVSSGTCTPGKTRMSAPAGCNESYCNKGVQQRIETCTASCSWGTPTAMGTCTIPNGVCRPLDKGGTIGYRCRPGDPGFRDPCRPSTASPELACTYGPREAFAGCD